MLTSRGHGSAAWDGRSFLGSSQPGTRTPSQSGLRHQVIELTAASGRSPSYCIPLTDLDCSTGDGKRQERKFLKGRREKAMGGEHKAVSRLHGIHEKYRCIKLNALFHLIRILRYKILPTTIPFFHCRSPHLQEMTISRCQTICCIHKSRHIIF